MTARELIERLIQFDKLDVDVVIDIEGHEIDIKCINESSYKTNYDYHVIKLD